MRHGSWIVWKLEAGEVHVSLDHHGMISWPCSECSAECKLYDHQAERRWRHLDTCQYQTVLVFDWSSCRRSD